MAKNPHVWYLSFATDAGFRGATIVQAGPNIVDAQTECSRLDINPGGQIAGWRLSHRAWSETPERFRNRLLTKPELAELDAISGGPGVATSIGEQSDDVPAVTELICENHNDVAVNRK